MRNAECNARSGVGSGVGGDWDVTHVSASGPLWTTRVGNQFLVMQLEWLHSRT